jgi:hypothetical protein
MARKNLGRTATTPREIVDKEYTDTKYIKPQNGIPGTDLAPKTITFDRLATNGSPSPATWLRGDGHWAPLVGNNVYVEPTGNYTLEPPAFPIDGQLVMFEVRPKNNIVVYIPGTIKLTSGMINQFSVPANISALVGLRWSQASSAWQMIALTMELY